MPITNGVVKYNRRVRTGDFEHKDADVAISFTVGDGEKAEAVVEYARSIAYLQGSVLVGEHPVEASQEAADKPKRQSRKVADPLAAAGSAPATAEAPSTTAPADPLSSGTATGPVLNTVGKPADPLASAGAVNGAATTSAAAGSSDPLAAAGTPTATPTLAQPVPSTPAAVTTDPLANAAGGTTPPTSANGAAPTVAAVPAGNGTPEIANVDLHNAIMATMQTLTKVYGNETGAAKVSELIRSYAPEAAQIALDKRAEFVEKLRTLA